jgi:arsenite methyltransferase
MTTQEKDIHTAVKQRYATLARESSCCCGSEKNQLEGQSSTDIYDPSTLAGLSSEVTELSLGCGDPVTIAGLKPGETVLDLGSGGGIDCFLAAQRVSPGGQVIGVDMTEEMIARANANKAKMGFDNVEFRLGQIEQLPVEKDSVDVIISNCVINLSPDKEAVFAEAFRVLKPGGRLSVSDIVTEGEFPSAMREDLEQWSACVAGALELERYLAIMKQSGFVELRVEEKVNAEAIIERREGMPAIYSARITGRKPNLD